MRAWLIGRASVKKSDLQPTASFKTQTSTIARGCVRRGCRRARAAGAGVPGRSSRAGPRRPGALQPPQRPPQRRQHRQQMQRQPPLRRRRPQRCWHHQANLCFGSRSLQQCSAAAAAGPGGAGTARPPTAAAISDTKHMHASSCGGLGCLGHLLSPSCSSHCFPCHCKVPPCSGEVHGQSHASQAGLQGRVLGSRQ